MISKKALVVVVAICFCLGLLLGITLNNNIVTEREYSPKTACHIRSIETAQTVNF